MQRRMVTYEGVKVEGESGQLSLVKGEREL